MDCEAYSPGISKYSNPSSLARPTQSARTGTAAVRMVVRFERRGGRRNLPTKRRGPKESTTIRQRATDPMRRRKALRRLEVRPAKMFCVDGGGMGEDGEGGCEGDSCGQLGSRAGADRIWRLHVLQWTADGFILLYASRGHGQSRFLHERSQIPSLPRNPGHLAQTGSLGCLGFC